MLSTANEHKADEIQRVLEGFDVELLPRPSDVADVDETADTLEGNALLKARTLTSATGEAAIADDTGLFVDALGGRPGVYSARYAGERASYDENVAKILRELSGVGDARRSAFFRTVIAVTYPDGASWFVEGVLEGTILTSSRGHGGFGYDPVFAPRSLGGTSLAELAPAEKDAISHRGRALRAFAERLSIS
ncbi:MAG TPA: RdgB/HAM1 family non-canonical purine NTP pyrophosphatase [Acidimicrobiales bacterium]|nr:RdgB/HAM1 family non-canonical purine NTP pyrophosphatase [Acidimicrobiales bacterium]